MTYRILKVHTGSKFLEWEEVAKRESLWCQMVRHRAVVDVTRKVEVARTRYAFRDFEDEAAEFINKKCTGLWSMTKANAVYTKTGKPVERLHYGFEPKPDRVTQSLRFYFENEEDLKRFKRDFVMVQKLSKA